jgi:translation initiation factor IF-2
MDNQDQKKDNNNGSDTQTGFSKILSINDGRKTLDKASITKRVNQSSAVTVEIKKRRGFTPQTPRPEQTASGSGLSQSDLTTKLNLIKNAHALEREAQIKKEQTKDSPAQTKPATSDAPAKPAPAPSLDKKPAFKDKAPADHEKQFEEQDANKVRPSFNKRRDSNRVIIQNIGFNEDQPVRGRSAAAFQRKQNKIRRLHQLDTQQKDKISREIILPEYITVAELASRMAEKGSDVVKKFFEMGMVITINQTVDADTAELVVSEFNHKAKRITDADVENILLDGANASEADLTSRPPVVTVMGHIDHGKTSLLDALRSTDVISGEMGGITQHIGAYQVQLKGGSKITFIDTPGHEVFTEMRLRGAMATDIVILVVAADDGIKDQTIEAISHAKAAKVPIIVAINKIDAVGADVQRVKTELLHHELVPESMGGDVMTVEVSALKRQNLDKLEEAILFQAEMLNLKANASGYARGVIIESKIDKSKGPIATLIVQKGTLRKGDIFIAGSSLGKIRTMVDSRGNNIIEALPSTPVEVTGLEASPQAGEDFAAVAEEKQARDICAYRIRKQKEQKEAKSTKTSLEELFKKSRDDGSGIKELPVIIKADVQGSVEAIDKSLARLSTDKVKVVILHKAVGGINESDVSLAKSSNAIILGFNVGTTSNAKKTAQNEAVEIRNYSIIYNLIDETKLLMEGKLDMLKKEHFLGKAEVRQVFSVPKFGKIAGAFVTEGTIKRNAVAKLLRNNIVIYEGTIKTLKRFKEDAKEVKTGYECGITLDKYDDIKEGDVIDAYEIIEEKDKL